MKPKLFELIEDNMYFESWKNIHDDDEKDIIIWKTFYDPRFKTLYLNPVN